MGVFAARNIHRQLHGHEMDQVTDLPLPLLPVSLAVIWLNARYTTPGSGERPIQLTGHHIRTFSLLYVHPGILPPIVLRAACACPDCDSQLLLLRSFPINLY